MRKLTLAGVLALVATAVVVAAGPASAASGGGCQLAGTATFDGAGLNTTSAPFTYGFTGNLTSCKASDASAPASGTVEAGQIWTDAATGNTFQEPRSTGVGGCQSSKTDGTAILKWADGTITVIGYHTDGAAAAVALQGSVLPSLTLTGTDALGNPTSVTITSTRYVGSNAVGALAFQATPTDCATGVHTAGISGFTGLGQQ